MAIVKFEHNGKHYDIDVKRPGSVGSLWQGLANLGNTDSKEYKQLVAMLKYSLDNDGQLPTGTFGIDPSITNTDAFERKYGIRFSGTGTEGFGGHQALYGAAKSGVKFIQENPDIVEERAAEAEASRAEADGLDPYYRQMFDRNNPDSVYNHIYGAFRDQGTIQHEQGIAESQRGERDLAARNAMERSQLMDQIRADRRSKLKSGLSSAQIANEEIQSQFIAQSLSNQNTRDFTDYRAGLRNQYAGNEQNAVLQAYNMFSTQGLGPIMGQQYASYTGDAVKFGERVDANPRIWPYVNPEK